MKAHKLGETCPTFLEEQLLSCEKHRQTTHSCFSTVVVTRCLTYNTYHSVLTQNNTSTLHSLVTEQTDLVALAQWD